MTTILNFPSLDLLRPLFLSREKPRDIFAQAEAVLTSRDAPLVQALRPYVDRKQSAGHDVCAAAMMDGVEAVWGQQGYGLFNPTRSRDATDWLFAQYDALDLSGMVQRQLETCAAALPCTMPALEVFIFPIDLANRTLMVHCSGCVAYGGFSGALFVRVWPSEPALARLPAALARAYVFSARQHALNMGALVTLGDWAVMEGLASAFVHEMFPDVARDGWQQVVGTPDGWEAELSHVAETWYGQASYSDVGVNVYGQVLPVGPYRPPAAHKLDAQDFDYTKELILGARAVTEPTIIAGHLYGDTVIRQQGHAPAGVSDYAGIAAGADLVQQAVQTRGLSLRDALVMPTAQLLGPA
jgi:uncharacterized protein YjaZ